MDNTNYFSVNSGIQLWKVPESGKYRITVYGAQGGDARHGATGGRGAKMEGDFNLNGGDTIKILVGQKGGSADSGKTEDGSGGGGGSFVVDWWNKPLIML